MEKNIISKEVIDEVEDLIDIDKTKTEEWVSTIIFDGRQFTLKIPKKIAEQVGLDKDKDKFVFQIETHPIEQSKKPSLTIILKRGEE